MTAAGDELWVGLDLGTQSVRALAVDSAGGILGSGTAKVTSRRDGERHEQDPEQWWMAASSALREALHGLGGRPIGGIAVDATSGTVLMADAWGHPLTPGIMYDDRRGAVHLDRINDIGAEVWAQLGYQRMQAPWALPKLLWLLENAPEATAGGSRLLHQADFMNERLTGHPVAADLSNALKTGADLVAEDWPRAVLDALGVPQTMLPQLVRSGRLLGTVSAEAAEATGLPPGTPVIAGATDGCASQLGAGALSVGSWNSVLGTTLVLKGVTEDLIRDPLGVVYSHKGPDGNWLPGGASSTGAGIVSRDFGGAGLASLERRARMHEPSAALTYPLVSPGERFPFSAAAARGFVLGTPEDQGDAYASVLQGVAFIERLCFDYLDLLGAPIDGPVVLTGGATRSSYWNQLRADVLARPVALPETAEPALGMAVLAASPGRRAADVAEEMVRIRQVVDPRPEAAGRLHGAHRRLVDELEQRGWLDAAVAAHARKRIGS